VATRANTNPRLNRVVAATYRDHHWGRVSGASTAVTPFASSVYLF
jgi:hypothetical protein